MSNSPAKKAAATAAVIAVIVADSGTDGLSGAAIVAATAGEHPQHLVRLATKQLVGRGVLAVEPGAKNSTVHRIARPCSECGHPLAPEHDEKHPECALADALGVLPALPGARCRGHHALFDATVARPRATIGALHYARTVALRLCTACPALTDCGAWLEEQPPDARPLGVIAGRITGQSTHERTISQ